MPPARRVSSSSSSVKIEKNYGTGSQNEQFVEVIDTNNNVLVRDDSNAEHHSQYQPFQQKESQEGKPVSPSTAYVVNSIEALADADIEENNVREPNNSSRQVSVYDNNQSIIKDEELERTGHSYLKHFYEKNEHIKEIDELI